MWPYMVSSEVEGPRGRLSSFFFCGSTAAPTMPTEMPESAGSKLTFDGIVYKLLAVNKGDGSYVAWGPFGFAQNDSIVTRSVVVAVPFAVAV